MTIITIQPWDCQALIWCAAQEMRLRASNNAKGKKSHSKLSALLTRTALKGRCWTYTSQLHPLRGVRIRVPFSGCVSFSLWPNNLNVAFQTFVTNPPPRPNGKDEGVLRLLYSKVCMSALKVYNPSCFHGSCVIGAGRTCSFRLTFPPQAF